MLKSEVGNSCVSSGRKLQSSIWHYPGSNPASLVRVKSNTKSPQKGYRNTTLTASVYVSRLSIPDIGATVLPLLDETGSEIESNFLRVSEP